MLAIRWLDLQLQIAKESTKCIQWNGIRIEVVKPGHQGCPCSTLMFFSLDLYDIVKESGGHLWPVAKIWSMDILAKPCLPRVLRLSLTDEILSEFRKSSSRSFYLSNNSKQTIHLQHWSWRWGRYDKSALMPNWNNLDKHLCTWIFTGFSGNTSHRKTTYAPRTIHYILQ